MQAKKADGSKASGSKRKANQMSEPAAGEMSPTPTEDDRNDQAPLRQDIQGLFAQFLQQATEQQQVTGQPPANSPNSAKDLEKARVKAEKDAAKHAKEAAAQQRKETAKDQKEAERVLTVAAKASAGLSPVSADLNSTQVPDNTPEVLETSLKDLKEHVGEMLKSAQAVITSSKKRGFLSSKPTLTFDGKDVTQAIQASRKIIKKLEGFGHLMES